MVVDVIITIIVFSIYNAFSVFIIIIYIADMIIITIEFVTRHCKSRAY